tara:strand:- start:154 stop:420 length:267 start_codon:yes stop_codon:yes gene_type:complete
MTAEKTHTIDGQEIKESDLTPEQRFHKSHIISLRNKIAKHQFEIDDLLPALQQHEQMLINSTKAQAEEELSNQEELNKQAEQAAAEES